MKDVVLEAERGTVGSRRVFRILIRGGYTPFTPLITPLVGRVVGRGGRLEAWWEGHILKEPALVPAFFSKL